MNDVLAYLIISTIGLAAWMMLDVDPDEYDPADKDKTMGDE